MLSEMKGLFKITGHGRRFLMLLFLRAPFDLANTLIQAGFLKAAFDAVAAMDSLALNRACLFYTLASLGLFLYNGTVWSLYAPFCIRLEGRLRSRLYGRISSFSCEQVEALPQGEWLTRLNTDVELPFSRPLHLPHAICAITNLCGSAFLLWHIHPTILGLVLLFVAPHIAFSQFLIARAMPSLSRASLEAKGKNTGELTALIGCGDTAWLYEGHDYLLRRFAQSSKALFRANMRIHARNSLSSGLLPLFGMGGYLTLLMVCSGWIGQGLLSFGDLTGAFQYRGGVLMGSMMLINCLVSIKASMAGIRRIHQTMGQEAEGL